MPWASKIVGTTLEVNFPERFTFNDNQNFRTVLNSFATNEISEVILDVGNTSFMDSAGLGMLLVARDEAKKANKPVRLKHPQGYVKKLFIISKFHDLFKIDE